MYFMGLDLGQRKDHSALVVVERIERRYAFQGTAFEALHVLFAERMRLGLPYTRIVERVGEIVTNRVWQGHRSLVVDATGVGAPVVDMLERAKLGCDLTAVTITGGEQATRNCVPKHDLMTGVLVLLERKELKIGPIAERARLVEELGDVRMTVSGSARVRMGAEGSGEHDDLVVALALACWKAKGWNPVGYQPGRLM